MEKNFNEPHHGLPDRRTPTMIGRKSLADRQSQKRICRSRRKRGGSSRRKRAGGICLPGCDCFSGVYLEASNHQTTEEAEVCLATLS